MRKISSELQRKLKLAQQTAYNDADPRAIIHITRPTVPLTSGDYLEKVLIGNYPSLSKTDIAVRHKDLDKKGDRVYVGYITSTATGSLGRVTYSPISDSGQYVWRNLPFEVSATDISVEFNGRMPRKEDGEFEFVTEEEPWIFWVNEGSAYGIPYGMTGAEIVTLANENATAISAVRATWAATADLDFGLVVFMVLNGTIYYRQYIYGEWKDAEIVTFGPNGVTWVDVAAYRTWDWRICIQAKTSTGEIYEIFSQFQGIGRNTAEHVEAKAATYAGKLTTIRRLQYTVADHVDAMSVAYSSPWYGIYELGDINLETVSNVADSEGNYGRIIKLGFDKELNAESVEESRSNITVIDSDGNQFYPVSFDYTPDGRNLLLMFFGGGFNNAVGDITVSYAQGTIKSMADMILEPFEITFSPINLDPNYNLPHVTRIWNI